MNDFSPLADALTISLAYFAGIVAVVFVARIVLSLTRE